MPSRPFGEYEVLARLATGGAANIFLARHPSARAPERRLVCLKTLLPERAKDRDFVDMFLDEARLAARLKHPNCVELYNFGKADLTYYLAMEYILGETVWGLLTTVAELRRPLPPAVVASIMASALDGLHAAHELADEEGRAFQVVHRDISPQNIMVTYEGRTKLLDFGIAKAETGRQATATGIVKGKFSYMSPEQITGGALDRRSDLYSIGIVLFECLASRRLYKGDSPEEIARMMLERRPPRLSELQSTTPAALDEICATALARHAKSRFSTAAEMAQALRDYLSADGHPSGIEPVAKLVGERFGDRIVARTRLVRSVLAGRYSEAELLESLGASPVLELDFRPAFSPDETIGEGGPVGLPDPSETGPESFAGTGFRVELERGASQKPSPLVREVPSMNLPRTTSHGLDLGGSRTRPEGEAEATLFDPARAVAESTKEHRVAELGDDTALAASGAGEGEAQVSEEFEEETDARWPDDTAESPAWRVEDPERARRGILGRAASFETDEVTSDTSPTHPRASAGSVAQVSVLRRGETSGIQITPVEVAPQGALFAGALDSAIPLVSSPPTPAPGPTPRPSVAPNMSSVPWSAAPPGARTDPLSPTVRIWVATAFVGGLALGLLVGFLLGRLWGQS